MQWCSLMYLRTGWNPHALTAVCCLCRLIFRSCWDCKTPTFSLASHSVQAGAMSTGGRDGLGDEAAGSGQAPLTHADIPELVKAVAEALSRKEPSSSADPRTKEGGSSPSRGELVVRRAINNFMSAQNVLIIIGMRCQKQYAMFSWRAMSFIHPRVLSLYGGASAWKSACGL